MQRKRLAGDLCNAPGPGTKVARVRLGMTSPIRRSALLKRATDADSMLQRADKGSNFPGLLRR